MKISRETEFNYSNLQDTNIQQFCLREQNY